MDLAESHMRVAGYAGFSFRDLAAEIGIKSASVHHHFPTMSNQKRIGLEGTIKAYAGCSRIIATSPYNLQVGAAELGGVIQKYGGNYILAFAAYNAGRGRVQEWIASHGDPRDAKVDPVDWVERIPFMETRNYVQRVMENVQVYRTRFGANAPLTIQTDLRGYAAAN